ncbi:MAG: 3-phosphoshikimate 1-carboxyvinyltransferase, partial [Thermoplasmata archaeon]|nr:3-phosphoshikimate 1-carboxyvinyltransferase [Thermoplasmata archaeon]
TLRHLERAGVKVWTRDMANFFIPAGQSYRSGDYTVPGDYSSAAFLQAAAIVTDSKIHISGLEQEDAQGDKVAGKVMEDIMSGRERTIDLRDTPDLLPILAVIACLADGETVLNNVAHARKKESDRISAMCRELGKMGATAEELPDGLKIHGSKLKGAELDGHGDHRIVMALAVAGLGAEGRTIINGADTVSKSYPGFVNDLSMLGAEMRTVDG